MTRETFFLGYYEGHVAYVNLGIPWCLLFSRYFSLFKSCRIVRCISYRETSQLVPMT